MVSVFLCRPECILLPFVCLKGHEVNFEIYYNRRYFNAPILYTHSNINELNIDATNNIKLHEIQLQSTMLFNQNLQSKILLAHRL